MTVGISKLSDQIKTKALKKGIDLNLMVIGRGGIGKSTLIDCLFGVKLMADNETLISAQSSLSLTFTEIVENGFHTRINLIETINFGDLIDSTNCWYPACTFIDEQYMNYLTSENQVKRSTNFPDPRVHVCLYLLEPNLHLKELDLKAMKALSIRVNLLVLIGKSDTMTEKELKGFKEAVEKELKENSISCFNDKVFSITASREKREGRPQRIFSWGSCFDSSDLKELRDLLIKEQTIDLMEATEVFYEKFRVQALEKRKSLIADKEASSKEEALKEKFSDQVKKEETRFKSWEKKLIDERDRLKKELEMEHAQLQALQDLLQETKK